MSDRPPIKVLGDVVEFQRGLTYAKGDEVESSGNVVLRATNIDLNTNLLDLSELRYINDRFPVPAGKRVRKDSLLICTASGSKSHLGKVAYIDEDYGYAFGGFMGMLTPKAGLLPRYLFHLMTSRAYRDFIDGLSDGANINNLKVEDLAKFPVPLPALAEQRRIVAILDEAFAAIATARANAEKNLASSNAIIAEFADARLRGFAAICPLAPIEEVCELENGDRGENYPSKSVQTTSGVPFINAGHLGESGIDFGEMNYIPRERFALLGRGKIRRNDVLFCLRGSLGKTALVSNLEEGAIASSLVIVRPGHRILPAYLLTYLRSTLCKKEIAYYRNGAAQPNLGAKSLARFLLPLPDLPMQQVFVEACGELRIQTDVLARSCLQKLAALDALKSSLLHHAFSGQLTANAAGHQLAGVGA